MTQAQLELGLKFKIYPKFDSGKGLWGVFFEELNLKYHQYEVSLCHYICHGYNKVMTDNFYREIVSRLAKNRNFKVLTYKSSIFGDYALFESLPVVELFWEPPKEPQ